MSTRGSRERLICVALCAAVIGQSHATVDGVRRRAAGVVSRRSEERRTQSFAFLSIASDDVGSVDRAPRRHRSTGPCLHVKCVATMLSLSSSFVTSLASQIAACTKSPRAPLAVRARAEELRLYAPRRSGGEIMMGESVSVSRSGRH